VDQLKPIRNEEFSLWSSKGKRCFLEKAAEMITRARDFGLATTSRFSRYPILDKAYLKALKKGIDIRILGTSTLDEHKKARALWYHKQGAKIRILPMNIHPILGIIDNKEVCVRIDNSPEPDFIWSNNPALVNVFKTYFEELWERGKEFELFI
jgi:sugar-specific transcriptional regulator TrmB